LFLPTPLLDPPTEFAIGAATGLLDCCAFHWIDTLKVRSQANLPLLLDLQRGGPLPPGSGSLAALRSLYAGFTTNLSLKLPYMAFAFGLNASSAGTPSRRFMTRHGRVDRQAIGSQQPRPLGLRW